MILKKKADLQKERLVKLAELLGLMSQFVRAVPPQTSLTFSPDLKPLASAADAMNKLLGDIEKLQRWKYKTLGSSSCDAWLLRCD